MNWITLEKEKVKFYEHLTQQEIYFLTGHNLKKDAQDRL
jgi:hypothetical protein